MDQSDDHNMNDSNGCTQLGDATTGIGNYQGNMDNSNRKKKEAVHAEIAKVNNLPSNSSYAIHRIKVLNKILHLLSNPRTMSQEEELELLFAGLSL